MGQKVNPHGLRVGVIKDWDSRWYARDDKVGDLIVVTTGAWKDTVGAIKSINEAKKSITISVEMFGRETPVELNFTEVKKM